MSQVDHEVDELLDMTIIFKLESTFPGDYCYYEIFWEPGAAKRDDDFL